ncbi:MAG: hypothetical protein AAF353_01355 [Pseudomonadota bacterium]
MSRLPASSATFERLNEYINLDRYPIHALDSPEGATLIHQAHEMMARDTLCLFDGFLRDGAVKELSAEIGKTEAVAHRVNHQSTVYGWMDNSGFAQDHPRSSLQLRKCGVISTEQIEPQGKCRELYQFDELTEFVRRLLGYDSLYRTVCPTLSIQINIMQKSETFGWHYDTNDGVVSFTIQNPDQGGGFEYVPLIRSEENENYPAVSRILDGSDLPRQPHMSPGSFSLFLGRRSLHRVAPVGETRVSRQSLLFSYDRKPNRRFPLETCQRLTSESTEPYLGALTPVNPSTVPSHILKS